MIIAYGKVYNSIELSRLRIAKFYGNLLLTRSPMKNISQTIGSGIIEIEDIDLRKQFSGNKTIFNRHRFDILYLSYPSIRDSEESCKNF